MKKIIAWLLVLALTAAISIGATLAYLTDTDEDVNVMTVGKVKIDQLEYERVDDETKDADALVQEFHDNKPLYPGVYNDDFNFTDTEGEVDWIQIGKEDYTSGIWNPEKINNELDKMVFVENKGNYDAYVRTVFAFEAGNYETLDEFKAMMHLNLNTTNWSWEWQLEPVTIGGSKYFVAVATYNDILEPGKLTEISLSQIALDKSATNADVEAFGETYNILVKTQAIQADGFIDPTTALTDGFGVITANAVPFTTDEPVKGIDLRTALQNLNGDPATPIIDKITNVVFGLNREFPDIVNNYAGTLVTEEQDVEIYSYYVEKDGQYSVYFLGNGDTCLPEDSSYLFAEMAALKSVDTSNLNTSKAQLMNHMFIRCAELTDIDFSNWDTSNVTTMRSMLHTCKKLPSVDVSNWDTSNLENATYLFRSCESLTQLDVSSFDMGNVENISYMFLNCYNLQRVDTTGWDTSKVTTTRGMFMNCYAMEEILGHESWDLSSNTDMYYMFQQCYPLTYLNVGNWGTSNVTTMQGTFYKCTGLETIEGLGEWDTSKVTNMYAMFNVCGKLESVEGIGNFNTANVEDMAHMFQGCGNLKEIDVANWDTGNVKAFNSLFSGSGHNTGEMLFTELAVENWDVSSAVNMECMFYGCGQLTELDLSAWDVSNVTNMRHIFADCFKIESYNFSGWNTASLQNLDGIFNSNKALEVVDVSDFDTTTVTNFAQVFDGCTNLKQIIGLDRWDTSNGQKFGEFLLGTSVESIDLSAFDMSSATNVVNMFHVNSKLTTIYVGDNWNLDTEKLGEQGMFGVSSKLKGGNGSTTGTLGNKARYARVDLPAVLDEEGNVITEAVPGLLTHINDKPVTP